jgi:uncharacterized delta-60 repeat protein
MSRKKSGRISLFELQPLEIRRFLTTASIDSNHILQIAGTGSADSITINGVASGTRATVTGVTSGGNLVQFTIGTGSNQFNRINVVAGSGNDTVQINNNFTYSSSTIAGNDGADNLIGGRGNDSLSGGNENDVMDGQGGADVMTGGSGQDQSNYSARTENLKITIDGVGNDGSNNGAEGDNVQTEEVLTGSGNDVVTGATSSNPSWVQNDLFGLGAGNDSSRGGDGNDFLTASTGTDSIFGENGDDSLQAKNQDLDVVNGGTNTNGTSDLDLASIDSIDTPNAVPAPIRPSRALTDLDAPTNVDAAADPSDLDPTFGDGGTVTGPDFNWSNVTAATVDKQGRTIIVGYDSRGYGVDFVATRYNADGSLDNFFGDGYGYGGEVAVDFGTNFGTGYSDDDRAFGVTTDDAGNIYIVGSTTDAVNNSFDDDFGVAKLDANGNLVWTRQVDIVDQFGSNETDTARDVVIQNDGKVVVAGTHQGSGYGGEQFAVLRLNADGTPDTSFSGDGMNTLDIRDDDQATSVALQSLDGDGTAQRIVVGGSSTVFQIGISGGDNLDSFSTDFAVARFTSTGAVDTSFNGNGYVVTPFVNADSQINDIAVNSSGQIFAVGSADVLVDPPDTFQTFGALARYNADGTGGITKLEGNGSTLEYNGVAIDSQGRVVAVGNTDTDFAIARYTNALVNDSAFGGGAVVTTDFSPVESSEFFDSALGVRVLSDGKIAVGGVSDTCGDGCVQQSAARYAGSPTNNEINVEEVEGFFNWDDLHPPQEPLASRIAGLSPSGQLYVLAQPNDDGEVTIDLPAGNNTVTFYCVVDGEGKQTLAVNVNGTVLYYDQSTTTLITINGNSGKDVILGCDSCVTVPLILNGAGGNDILTGGKAGDIILGGPGLDLLYSGGGNDVIVGGDGIDGIAGGGGRSILIGGTGNDGIVGWSDEDIIIGGSTAYDTNIPALQSLIAEWSAPTLFSVRVSNIRNGGGLNGTNVLKVGAGATVLDDSAVDVLTGLGGRDWFFQKKTGSKKDSVLDFNASSDIVDAV